MQLFLRRPNVPFCGTLILVNDVKTSFKIGRARALQSLMNFLTQPACLLIDTNLV